MPRIFRLRHGQSSCTQIPTAVEARHRSPKRLEVCCRRLHIPPLHDSSARRSRSRSSADRVPQALKVRPDRQLKIRRPQGKRPFQYLCKESDNVARRLLVAGAEKTYPRIRKLRHSRADFRLPPAISSIGPELLRGIHTLYNSTDYVGFQSTEPSVTGSCTNHSIQVSRFDVIVINNDEVPDTNVSQLQRNMGSPHRLGRWSQFLLARELTRYRSRKALTGKSVVPV